MRIDLRVAVATLGLACLWACLQASGFYPLSLVPRVGGMPVHEVALVHLAYVALVVVSALATAAASRSEHFRDTVACPLRSSVLVPWLFAACGTAGHAMLIVSDGALPGLPNFALVGSLLSAAFVTGSTILWFRALLCGCTLGVRAVAGLSIAGFIASQALQAAYYGIGLDPAALMLVAPVISSLGIIALRGTSSLGGASPASCSPADGASCDGSATNTQPQACDCNPGSTSARDTRLIIVPSLILIYFCDIFVRLVLPAYTGDTPVFNKFLTCIIALVLGILTLASVRLVRVVGRDRLPVIAFSLLAADTMVAMALMLLVEGDLAFVARRMLVAGEHCIEAFVWVLLAVSSAHAGRPASPSRAAAAYLLLVAAIPWALSFDAYYLLGLDTIASGSTALHPVLVVALLVVALGVMAMLLALALRTTADAARAIEHSRKQATIASDELVRRAAESGRASHEARVREALAGFDLTDRELEVATLACHGLSAKRIGEELFLSEATVKSYASRMYRKMGIHSKQELIALVDGRRGA